MHLRNVLLLATLALTACQTHHHAINITSKPTAQEFEIEAWDQWGDRIGPLYSGDTAIISGVTPQQIMYPENVARARIKLKFSRSFQPELDDQTKMVQFGHPYVEYSSYHDPIFGLNLPGRTITTKITPQTVHFDRR